MSKEAEEYLKEWKKLQYRGYNESVIGEPRLTENNVIKFAQDFADQQIKERLNSVTDKDIANKAEIRPDDLDNVKSFNAGYRTGAKWILNLLKKK